MPDPLIQALLQSSPPQDPSQSSWLHDLALSTMPGPQTGSIAQDVAGAIPTAMLGLGGPAKFHYTSQGRPMLQSGGRITSINRPFPYHPAIDRAPAIATADAAANLYSRLEDQNPPGKAIAGIEPTKAVGGIDRSLKGDRLPMAGANPDSGWGMPKPYEPPAWLSDAQAVAPPVPVPLPRPKPKQEARKGKAKTRAPQGPSDVFVGDQIMNFLRSLGLG